MESPASSEPTSNGGHQAASPARAPSSNGFVDGWGSAWAMAFSMLVVLSGLLALAFVPPYLNQGVARIQDRIQNVLEPAEGLAAEIELAQTQEWAFLEAWVFTGEGRFRQRYRDAYRAELNAVEALRPLTEGMALTTREAIAGVTLQAFPWHTRLEGVLNETTRREDFLEEWRAERSRFDDVLSATRELRRALAAETESGLRRMAEARTLQTRITRGLVVLALGVPLMVLLFLGWRMRSLMIRAEEARRTATAARREADALLEATGDGVLGMDREGRCVFLNRAGAELLGRSVREAAGRDVHPLIHGARLQGDTRARKDCPVLEALRTGRAISGRNETFRRVGGTPLPVQISVRPLRDGDVTRGAVLTFTDMREARAAEESLKQALRARDEVLGIVSHDLRNPVGTIFSSASLLLELELAPEKQRDHLASIKRSAGRMNRLIQDLLDVARMEAGVLRVVPAHFHLDGVFEEVLALQKGTAEGKGIRLRSSLQESEGRGWGDRDRILQVLVNLVDNGLKFTPAGGWVELGAREEPHEDGFLFWVADSGPGIAPEDQDRLFDRFWQVGRRDKRGAGLGLSIVKGLVEAHGGTIWVESEPGEGSTFLFRLPNRSLITRRASRDQEASEAGSASP